MVRKSKNIDEDINAILYDVNGEMNFSCYESSLEALYECTGGHRKKLVEFGILVVAHVVEGLVIQRACEALRSRPRPGNNCVIGK